MVNHQIFKPKKCKKKPCAIDSSKNGYGEAGSKKTGEEKRAAA